MGLLHHRNGQVGGRAAEHIGQQDHPVAVVHGGGGIDDVAPTTLHVVFGADADGRDPALRADHVLHRRKKF